MPSWFQTNQWHSSHCSSIAERSDVFHTTPDHLAKSGWNWRRLTRQPITTTECIHSFAQSVPNFRPKSQNQDPRRGYCPLAVKCRYCRRASLSASSCKNCQTQRRLEQDKKSLETSTPSCISYCVSAYNVIIN